MNISLSQYDKTIERVRAGLMLWNDDSLFFYQLDAQILYFNTFIILIYMFRALLCSSSGGQL